MFWDEELAPEEEEEIIDWTARKLFKYGMETAAILFLESYKPMSRIGTSMGTIFLTPLMPLFGDNTAIRSQKVLKLFQEDKNVEKLIIRLEEITKEHSQKEREKRKKQKKTGEDNDKPWWKRLMPFIYTKEK